MDNVIIKAEGTCMYHNCELPATTLACEKINKWGDYRDEIGMFCEEHARKVADTRIPEYIVDCPNCGCIFGVN